MSFRITGLPAGHFAHLFDLTDDELAARGAVRRIADARNPGYPCRVSLTDSRAGDELLLVNYEHHAVESPYRMRFAIYVRRGEETYDAVDAVPEQLRTCTLAVRSFDADAMMRPASSRDTKFFWDGVNAHELRIQKRPDGSLQHPPVPALWQDAKKEVAAIDYVVASGKGTVFSFVVHHAPKVPGRTLPFVIALVELEEGVRMLGELRNVDPAKVGIGMPVRATYIDFPEGDAGPAWTLYAWEPGE